MSIEYIQLFGAFLSKMFILKIEVVLSINYIKSVMIQPQNQGKWDILTMIPFSGEAVVSNLK